MKSLSDNLSFYRLGLLWNYYSKWIYSQAIIYAIIIVFIYLLSLSASYYIFVFWLVSGTGQSILSMLFYVGPLIFAIPANRKAEIMLPASVTEKITFYLGYTFIAVPAFISILWLTCIGIGCIFSDHGNVQALYNEGMSLYSIFTFSETGTPLSYLTDAMLSILMPATSLYAIIKARRLRVLWGIGGVAIAFFYQNPNRHRSHSLDYCDLRLGRHA